MLWLQMKCAFCQNPETKVVDKRDHNELTRRRRECLKCKKRFTTHEKSEDLNLIIVKKDNRREHFNPQKLKSGILKACQKRPVSIDKIDDILERIESSLRKLKTKEINASIIGEKVIKELKKLDNVAYIRFASVYKDFKDIDDFKKALKEIKR